MTTNYDPIAEQYKRSKQMPWRTFVECYTLMQLAGDANGLAVLDVACGEGFYTRMIRQQGADRVTGVDLSQGMITLAQQQEDVNQQGIAYIVGDARELPVQDEYDLAIAAYLLNYARTREELQSMCDGIARALKPGGRFVTVNSSPAFHFPTSPSFRQFGFETQASSNWEEGTPITWTFHLEDGPFDIENYYLSVPTHEAAFRQAGFSEVRWHPPQLSPDGLQDQTSAFWSPLLENSPIAFIECVK
jgi:ubiquinone/menaquinone biosynthesis C-methylase UbiE